jgi:hypothetical protein
MTTITIDDDTLKSVDKLQSLLKLRFDTFSGDNITRGGTVNWAVNQQISAMTTPITFMDGFIEGTSFNTNQPTSTTTSMNYTGQPIMVAYMTQSPAPTVSTTQTKTKTRGDE